MKEKSKKVSVFIYSIYGLTIFISAFLLFQIQPLISKYILPWFGGAASVWTICVIFFQTILLIGYLYAHLITKYFSNKKQIIIHTILLGIAIVSLPILPDSVWQPTAGANPAFHILLLLTVAIALPVFILSATSPLIQTWFSKVNPKKSPYKLYALSNAGSLIALLSFPFLFEPFLAINTQADLWANGFTVFVFLCALAAIFLWKFSKANAFAVKDDETENIKPKQKTKLAWLGLSACASILFLAVTEKISQDISVIPFLWVVPLSLYLLTFIIAFAKKEKKNWHKNSLFIYILIISIISLFLFIGLGNIVMQVFIYSLILFLFCLVCHNELVRLKPHVKHLTSFYLIIAIGGITGGVFVGIIAPLIFSTYLELPLILIVCSIITLLTVLKARNFHWNLKRIAPRTVQFSFAGLNKQYQFTGKVQNLIIIPLIIFMLLFGIGGMAYANNQNKLNVLERSRNFYGKLTVKKYYLEENNNEEIYHLLSGHILHGAQFASSNKTNIPITYYGDKSGIAALFNTLKNDENRRIGAIGLGVGTIAAYGKSGDYFKFYEINPEVERLAQKHFSFLADSRAEIEIVIGDARINMEKEEPQNFDIIVLDAFSSDSIPIHLLTKEAFEIYLKHTNPDGIIAVHISNRNINLKPVLMKVAQHFNFTAKIIEVDRDLKNYSLISTWVLLSADPEQLDSEEVKQKASTKKINIYNQRLWTDDYSNIFKILK